MTYDQWKTTDPRDYEPEEEEAVSELETALDDLRASQIEARKYREALLNLFCVVKALSCPGGLSSPTLREYLRTHPAAREAADALRTDRLDDPKFRMQDIGRRWEDEALYPDRRCDMCGEIRRIGDHSKCDELPF